MPFLVEAEVVGIRLQPGEVAASTKPGDHLWPCPKCADVHTSKPIKDGGKMMENDGK